MPASVSSRKTSSRVGRRSEMSSASSPSSRTTVVSAPIRSATGALTRRASTIHLGVGARAPPPPRATASASRTTTSIQSPPSDAFSASGVSSAITRPRSITAIRSASWSASSSICVVSTTVVPSATSARTAAHTSLRPRGSSPVVGSSRNSTGGDEDQAGGQVQPPPHPARVLRHRLARPRPPGRSAPAARPPARAQPPTRRWNSRPKSTRFWRPLSTSSTAAFCPTSPIRRRTPAGSRATSTPGDLRAARVRPQQRGEDPHRRGLARAVGPQQPADRAGLAPRGPARPAP